MPGHDEISSVRGDDRVNLARIFTALDEEGVIAPGGESVKGERGSYVYWFRLPDVLLKGMEELDLTWCSRAEQYLGE